jgi:hypothetical protein
MESGPGVHPVDRTRPEGKPPDVRSYEGNVPGEKFADGIRSWMTRVTLSSQAKTDVFLTSKHESFETRKENLK